MVDRTGATVRIVESQLGGNAFCAVELLLVVEDGLDLGSEYGIVNQSAVPLGAASFPFIVGAAVQPEYGAHPLDRVIGAVVINKPEADHQFVSSMKYLAALRKISRSSFRRAFSCCS